MTQFSLSDEDAEDEDKFQSLRLKFKDISRHTVVFIRSDYVYKTTTDQQQLQQQQGCVCVRVCVRACVRACVCVWRGGGELCSV